MKRLYSIAMGEKVLMPSRFTYRPADNAYVLEIPEGPGPVRNAFTREVWEDDDGKMFVKDAPCA
jgi:hypothetical protein